MANGTKIYNRDVEIKGSASLTVGGEVIATEGGLAAGIVGAAELASDAVTLAKTASEVLKRTVVTLTNAQVLALRATPITLVAAQGANTIIEFVSARLIGTLTSAYTETADNLAIRYVGTTGVLASQAIEATGFVDQTGTITTNALPKIDTIATGAQAVNTALVLHNTGDGEFGGGNAANTLKVVCYYRVIDTTATS